MINKQLINYLISNSGQLSENETWYDIGERFYVTAPNTKKAKKDKKYKKKAVARKAQQIWQKYLSQKNNLRLDKEIYDNGKLRFETFKNKPENVEMDFEGYDLERVTTNPYGGMWMKYKKAGPNQETFREIIESQDIKAWDIKRETVEGESDLMLIISDTHIGAKSSNGQTYTKEVYQARLKAIVERTVEQQTEPYNRLIIVHLGDWLDSVFTNSDSPVGYTTRGGHAMPSQYSPVESFKIAYETHLTFIKSLREQVAHEEMEVIMMTNSNHDSDTAFAASTCCEIHLKYLDPDIKYTTSTEFIETLKIQDVIIGLSHGKDREYLNRPLPRVMTEKVENYLISYCLDRGLNPKKFICLSGDQHNWTDTISRNLRYIKCPSLFGSSEHAEINYGRSILGYVTAEFKVGATIKTGVNIKPELL